MNHYNLSYSDLRLLDDWKEPQPDVTTLARLLFENGLDITKPYEITRRVHRNLRDDIVDDYRVEGYERVDTRWRHSGAASLSAYLYSTEDLFLKEDMRKMSRRSDEHYAEKVQKILEGD